MNIGTFVGAAVMQSAAAMLTTDGDYSACVLPMASAAFIALVVSGTLWPAREVEPCHGRAGPPAGLALGLISKVR